jgi:hypothetical protein
MITVATSPKNNKLLMKKEMMFEPSLTKANYSN